MSTVLCPHCKGAITYAPSLAGEATSCPHCEQAFLMPSASECEMVAEHGQEEIGTPENTSGAGRSDAGSSARRGELSRLMSCPDCERDISKRATSCPHCGCPISSIFENTSKDIAGRNCEGKQKNEVERYVVEEENQALETVRGLLGVLCLFSIIGCGILLLWAWAVSEELGFSWTVYVFVWLIVGGFLGGILGTFNGAPDIGALLGVAFGPLGVIGTLAIDVRRQCPMCKGKLEGQPVHCPYCSVGLYYKDRTSATTPKTVAQLRLADGACDSTAKC